MWIVGLAVGIVIGLGLGIVVSAAFILPRMTQEVLFAINPVQVSGTVSVAQRARYHSSMKMKQQALATIITFRS
jgi:hypothetical protein